MHADELCLALPFVDNQLEVVVAQLSWLGQYSRSPSAYQLQTINTTCRPPTFRPLRPQNMANLNSVDGF